MPGEAGPPYLGKLNTKSLKLEWPGLKSQFLYLLAL